MNVNEGQYAQKETETYIPVEKKKSKWRDLGGAAYLAALMGTVMTTIPRVVNSFVDGSDQGVAVGALLISTKLLLDVGKNGKTQYKEL